MRVILALITVLTGTAAAEWTPRLEVQSPEALKDRTQVIDRGLALLLSSANADGSYGTVQMNLQTSLAVLALLSSGITPDDRENGEKVVRAYRWVFSRSGGDGFMGDGQYPHHSHAVAGLMAASLMGMGSDAAENQQIAQMADRALNYSLKVQNKAVGAAHFGGWSPDPKEKINDRLVTAWQLLFFKSMEYAHRKIPKQSITRATEFILGSQKDPSETTAKVDKEDIGGFSYDAAGLPVVSVTSAGLAVIGLYRLPDPKRALAVGWLKEHPPIWHGPHFYETHLFGARGMLHHARLADDPAAFDRYFRKVYQLLKDHQEPDGSFLIPPGSAENTKVMGRVYATAMAVLILNADRELLPVDAAP